MLTLAIIREKTDEVIQRLKVKNFNAEEIVNRILELDKNRRSLQNLQDSRQNEMNTLSKSIGSLIREGRKE
jgi:seryl-tRNA synthetase